MAKYSFKVYLNDGSSVKVIPSSLVNTDLYDMDKYAESMGGYLEFSHSLANEAGINPKDIKKITILRNKKEVEFSLVIANPYLAPVLDDLFKKKIQGYGPYKVEAMVVSSLNTTYLKMRDYVFKKLREDYQGFLNNIYTYNNEFAELLNRYGDAYSQGSMQEEDVKTLRELEERICLELRIYKNYRGMCRRRKKYEDTINLGNIVPKKRRVTNLKVTPAINNRVSLDQEYKSASIQELTEMYNQEYDEFLDADEYSGMFDEDMPKGYK